MGSCPHVDPINSLNTGVLQPIWMRSQLSCIHGESPAFAKEAFCTTISHILICPWTCIESDSCKSSVLAVLSKVGASLRKSNRVLKALECLFGGDILMRVSLSSGYRMQVLNEQKQDH